MTQGGKLAAAAIALAVLAGCSGGSDADACAELELLTEQNPDALAADADDPDGLFAGCIEQIADQVEDMTPEEREAFFSR